MTARHLHHHLLPPGRPADGWTRCPFSAGEGARRRQGGVRTHQGEPVSGPLAASRDPRNLSGPQLPPGPAHCHQGHLLHHLVIDVNSDFAGLPPERVSVWEATQAPSEKTPSPPRGFEEDLIKPIGKKGPNQEIGSLRNSKCLKPIIFVKLKDRKRNLLSF